MFQIKLLVATIIAALLLAFDAQAVSAPSTDHLSSLEMIIVATAMLWTVAVFVLLRRNRVLTADGLGVSNRTYVACSPPIWMMLVMLLYLAPVLGSSFTAGVAGITASADPTPRITATIITGSYLFSLLACLAVVFFVQQRDQQSGLRWSMAGATKGLLASVLFLPILFFLAFVLQTLFTLVSPLLNLPEPESIAHSTLDMLVSSPRDLWWWLLVAGALIGAPIVEEIMYRGVLQAGLRAAGFRVVPTVLITSLLFTLSHLGAVPSASWPTALPMLFALSVILGILMERSGNIAAPILFHAAFNTFNLVVSIVGT